MASNLGNRLALTAERRALRLLICASWAADWLVGEDILMEGEWKGWSRR